MRRRARRAAVELGMSRCDLHEVRRRRVGHLSRGYRQRVGLAAAMLHDPPALVLDEPTSALDPRQIRQIRGVVRELARDKAVLVSSHILSEVEQTCDRVVILAGGRVMADARPAELVGRSGREPYIIEARPHRSPAELLAALRAVPGVAEAREQVLADGCCRVVVHGTGPGDLREPLGAAAGAVATIRELARERPSLERAFLGLISGEGGGA
jgi:ABC-2 type transport system ATP-binding protein